MKLLLLIFSLAATLLTSGQYIKPEIKKLIEKTELNPSYKNSLNVQPGSRPPSQIIRLQNQNLRGLDINENLEPAQLHKYQRKIFLKDTVIKGLNYFLQNPRPGTTHYNMPVIVPDTKDIVAIPNAWKGKIRKPFIADIPNGVIPKGKIKEER